MANTVADEAGGVRMESEFRRVQTSEKWVDSGTPEALVILNSNPLGDISHASDIESVKKNGVLYPADSILR